MARKEDHARHNMDLCTIIRTANKHHDWTITTAFYSALHFVDLKIFPFTVSGGLSCDDIKTAKIHLRTSSKHQTRLELVKLQCIEIYKAYRWLYDYSSNARYETFKFTPTQADKAVQYLNLIEQYCTKP